MVIILLGLRQPLQEIQVTTLAAAVVRQMTQVTTGLVDLAAAQPEEKRVIPQMLRRTPAVGLVELVLRIPLVLAALAS